MKKLLPLLILLIFSENLIAKGCSGTYYIKGIVHGNKKAVLKNAELIVIIGTKTTTVITNEKGGFEIAVEWVNTCPSLISKEQHEANNAKRNPKIIYIKYKDIQIEVENNWKKYARCCPKSRKQVTRKQNLNFII